MEYLLHHHLREKCLENALGFYAILEEADVYAKHPQNLIENYRALAAGNVGYFFTRSRPNETQPDTSTGTDHVQAGHWIFGKELDVLHQGEKVGVKQLLEYCAAGAKTRYKIIEYRLDPCPDNLKDGPWFLCKLYNDGSYMEVQR
ncbi:protein SOMBRERO-like [Pyrus x bretschneideri]|uniref:protein SOMBRERO-like n=1 Tax=Pyrus x bretschneideri TaxID=225117 RepID=UPI002030D57D|nr:protein SOMBRERO-like [Pyrus x bretschneideri]XP_048425882.1 protein SOMBRERO-like [Pyrus x bretschneideri]